MGVIYVIMLLAQLFASYTVVDYEEAENYDYTYGYSEVLDMYKNVVCNYSDDIWYIEGITGVAEVAMYEGFMAEHNVGYMIEDISGDGTPELIIGEICDYETDANMIYALYTFKNGEPVLVFEGWARNRYYWLGDGAFYNEGSSGASESVFATYTLSNDGAELICTDYCFTCADGYDDIACYHNTVGESSIALSERISDEEFRDAIKVMEEKKSMYRLTPLSYYKAGSEEIHVYYEEHISDCIINYDTFVSDGDPEWQTGIFFIAEEPVTDFKLLGLSESETSFGFTYKTQVLYTYGELTEERPILIRLGLMDSPVYGISYVTESGIAKRFSIEDSGMDGTLILMEF